LSREAGCLYDGYSRRINYLRLSVIDRCNLRCRYCRPEDGAELSGAQPILSFEEIFEFVRVAVDMGVDKVRVTGGEPLFRRDIVKLVGMLATLRSIRDLAMTTNGTLLARYARSLKEAGLHRVNVSLDSVDPVRYREITRAGRVEDVLEGIAAAREAGLSPVKINCVIQQSPDEPDAAGVAEFARREGLEVRFIREMDLATGRFWQVIGGDGGHCAACSRLRLTCQGELFPCLFSDLKYDIRELGNEEAIRQAVAGKPESGRTARNHSFDTVGG
jgi:cyclic pyranopterin phosphate synthase